MYPLGLASHSTEMCFLGELGGVSTALCRQRCHDQRLQGNHCSQACRTGRRKCQDSLQRNCATKTSQYNPGAEGLLLQQRLFALCPVVWVTLCCRSIAQSAYKATYSSTQICLESLMLTWCNSWSPQKVACSVYAEIKPHMILKSCRIGPTISFPHCWMAH